MNQNQFCQCKRILTLLLLTIIVMAGFPQKALAKACPDSDSTQEVYCWLGYCPSNTTNNHNSLPDTDFDPSKKKFRKVDFSGADFNRANFRGANLHDVSMIGSDLTGVNLTQANLANADLSNVKLAAIKDPGSIDFSDFNWEKVTNIQHSDALQLAQSKLTREDIIALASASLSKQDLLDLIKDNPKGLDFNNFAWQSIQLSRDEALQLARVHLSSQDLLTLAMENPKNLDFTGVDPKHLHLSSDEILTLVDYNLTNAGWFNHSTLDSQDLVNLVAKYHLLTGIDFSGWDLEHSDMTAIDLRFSDLSGADLRHVNLNGAKMPDGSIYRP